MPLYAYRCTQCGHRFEKIQNFSAKPELECPKCHGVLERPLTAPRLHFKGAGWYVNDYASKSSGSESEFGSEPDSKSATNNDSNAGTKSETSAKSTEAKKPSTASESTPSTPAAAPASSPAAPSSSTT